MIHTRSANVPCYFETLPLHPQPARLESLTSFLMRLAAANGIQTLSCLAPLSFPLPQLTSLADCPLVSFGMLPTITTCPASRLQATTFFHLFRKFGRGVTQRRFVSKQIVDYVRYCPHCLVEHPYYVLPWRFLRLRGCHQHACQLLEACGHCDRRIPLFQLPSTIGICPACQHNLRCCRTPALTEEQRTEVQACSEALEFLLAPQPWEASVDQLAHRLGQYYALLRTTRGVSLVEAGRTLGRSLAELNNIEQVTYGVEGPIGANFQCYFDYTVYLGVTFLALFAAAVVQPVESSHAGEPLCEEEVLARLQPAVTRLHARGEPITQAAVGKLFHLSRTRLMSYPQVWEQLTCLVTQTRSEKREYRDAQLLEQVLSGVEHLQALHQPVTRRAVSTQTEIPFHLFCTRPHIVRVLQQHKRRRSYEQEGELLSRVEAARGQIEQEGKPLTLTALVELVGVSPKVLRKYPRIRTLLDEVVLRSRRQRLAQRSACEEEYLANIAVVAAQLGASPEPLTQKALCRLAGIPLSCLSSSPRLLARVKDIVLASKKTDQL